MHGQCPVTDWLESGAYHTDGKGLSPSSETVTGDTLIESIIN